MKSPRTRPAVYLDLESEADRAKLTEPALYLAQHEDKLVILDEIQRTPQLFGTLRGLIDAGRRRGHGKGRFLVLGSASIDLLKQSSESLAGRIRYLELAPLDAGEVGARRLDALWLRGGFPDSLLAASDAASLRWRRISSAPISNATSRSSGRASRPRRCAGSGRCSRISRAGCSTPRRWRARSRSTARRSPPTSTCSWTCSSCAASRRGTATSQKRLVKSPKVYVRDSGLVHALLGIDDREALLAHPVSGGSWEGLAIESLIAAAPWQRGAFLPHGGRRRDRPAAQAAGPSQTLGDRDQARAGAEARAGLSRRVRHRRSRATRGGLRRRRALPDRQQCRGAAVDRPVHGARGRYTRAQTPGSPVSAGFTESVVEDAALAWLESAGLRRPPRPRHRRRASPAPSARPELPRGRPGGPAARRRSRGSIPTCPPRRWKTPSASSRAPTRRRSSSATAPLHRMLVDGVHGRVPPPGRLASPARRRGWSTSTTPTNNDWLAVNQFTVVEGQHNRRPDVVLFVNGLPLAVIELKNPADENATIWTRLPPAPDLQGADPRALRLQRGAGRLRRRRRRASARSPPDREWFMPWRTIDGRDDCAARSMPELEVLLRGRLRASAASSTCCATSSSSRTTGGGELAKKMAGYHQFHAVNVAVEETLARGASRATLQESPGRYEAGQQPGGEPGRPARRRRLAHPGLGQEPDHGLLRRAHHPAPGDGEPDHRRPHRPQRPGRPALRHLRPLPRAAAPAAGAGRQTAPTCAKLLQVAAGGVVFTTIQKFFPEEKGDRHPVLSDRRNIVVIADEAHRSQYDFIDGFARHMRDALPNASFIGFTGTPIELTDAQHARRLRRLHQRLRHPAGGGGRRHGAHLLREPPGQAGAEGGGAARRSTRSSRKSPRARRSSARRSSRAKWAQLEAVVGAEKRVELIAARPGGALREPPGGAWTARPWSSA